MLQVLGLWFKVFYLTFEVLSSEQKLEVVPSPTKRQLRASPAKKKRKAPQIVTDSKPSVGVHGSDLFLQARLAAEVRQ
jgi:hypothetical protein